MAFQWDANKARANERKHRVSFEEAACVFGGFCLHRPDMRHDYGELRFVALGLDNNGVLLNVVYALRGEDIRIISAWRASRHEREIYQQAQEADPQARAAGPLREP